MVNYSSLWLKNGVKSMLGVEFSYVAIYLSNVKYI
jgi:hypothetical protein